MCVIQIRCHGGRFLHVNRDTDREPYTLTVYHSYGIGSYTVLSSLYICLSYIASPYKTVIWWLGTTLVLSSLIHLYNEERYCVPWIRAQHRRAALHYNTAEIYVRRRKFKSQSLNLPHIKYTASHWLIDHDPSKHKQHCVPDDCGVELGLKSSCWAAQSSVTGLFSFSVATRT